MSTFDRRPRLRWLVPGAAVAVIAAGAFVGTSGVTADAGLEPLTAEQLLVAVSDPSATALSGTVAMAADLGLPALPAGMGGGTSGPLALVSGENTLRVWTDGPDRSRIAVIGDAAEYDVIRNGDVVWTWSSEDATATRHVLEAPAGTDAQKPVLTDLPSTPQEAADLVLSALEPTTDVSVAGVASVAGRPVYELILTPEQGRTRVARVAIAIDAETKVPLRVQVFSTVMSEPALEVGFRSVDFTQPDPALFDFTPPPGATVTEHDGADTAKADSSRPDTAMLPTVVGEGWSQVVVAQLPTDPSAGTDAEMVQSLLDALPVVSGDWGTGRVVDGTLVSAIVTDDGRVAVGAVDPTVLGAALASQ